MFKVFLFHSCQLTRTIVVLLWSYPRRGSRILLGLTIWEQLVVPKSSISRFIRELRAGRLWSIRGATQILCTLGGFVRCSRMAQTRFCLIVRRSLGYRHRCVDRKMEVFVKEVFWYAEGRLWVWHGDRKSRPGGELSWLFITTSAECYCRIWVY